MLSLFTIPLTVSCFHTPSTGAGETAEALAAFFLERVRTNLHVILCMSPVGEAFRERCRMFPGLVNCTTIDWFTEWPSDALFEVASKQVGRSPRGSGSSLGSGAAPLPHKQPSPAPFEVASKQANLKL